MVLNKPQKKNHLFSNRNLSLEANYLLVLFSVLSHRIKVSSKTSFFFKFNGSEKNINNLYWFGKRLSCAYLECSPLNAG